MFPPMGFLGSGLNMPPPSTFATTWLVMTTAIPNCEASSSVMRLCGDEKTTYLIGETLEHTKESSEVHLTSAEFSTTAVVCAIE